MAKCEKWIQDGYKYCEKHDQHYRKYCCCCALGLDDYKALKSNIEKLNGIDFFDKNDNG